VASAGLVAQETSAWTPAAAQRAGSSVHDLGRFSSPSISACPRTPGVGEVDRDLGDLDPPGGAGVLPLHPDRATALLNIAGLVDYRHRTGLAEVTPNIKVSGRSRRVTACLEWPRGHWPHAPGSPGRPLGLV
jgi:hypothetical protein